MRKYEQGCQKEWTTVVMTSAVFNLHYLRYFCMDFFMQQTQTEVL